MWAAFSSSTRNPRASLTASPLYFHFHLQRLLTDGTRRHSDGRRLAHPDRPLAGHGFLCAKTRSSQGESRHEKGEEGQRYPRRWLCTLKVDRGMERLRSTQMPPMPTTIKAGRATAQFRQAPQRPRPASLASRCAARKRSWYFTSGGNVLTWAYPFLTNASFAIT